MDINNIFQSFLESEVNLNPARHKRIKDAEIILTKFIANSDDFKGLYINTIPQGSYRQGTITKPVDENAEFDVDFLIELKENSAWDPSTYLARLAEAFRKNGIYKDITDTDGKTRCVTIDYEGEFHVDLVPAIKKNGKYYIFNKKTNQIEETDGDGYAQWFATQNILANGNLIEVVRLIKYLRDRNEDFNTKSIIITTLVGMLINTGSHNNLPESLTTILSGIDSFLASYQQPPLIVNPAMPGENFNRHWREDATGFKKLKDAISTYSKIANKATSLSGNEAILEWRKIFGEKFGTLAIANNSDGVIFRAEAKSRPYNPYGN